MIYLRRLSVPFSLHLLAAITLLDTACVAGRVDTSPLVAEQDDGKSSSLPPLPDGYDEPPKSACTANVIGFGKRPIEIDYLPNVLQCEHGDTFVPLAALQAQAVAARTYLYVRTRGGSVPICNSYLCQVAYCNKPILNVNDRKLWIDDRVPEPLPVRISEVPTERIRPAYKRFFDAVQTTEGMILMGVSETPTDARVRKYYNSYYATASEFTGGTAYTEYTQGTEECSPCSTQEKLDVKANRGWEQCTKAFKFPAGQVDRRDGHMGQHNASCRARVLGEDYRALLAFYYSRDAALARWSAQCDDSVLTAGYVDYVTPALPE